MNHKNFFSIVMAFFVLAISNTNTFASSEPNHDFSLADAEQVNFTTNTLNKVGDSIHQVSFSAFGQDFNLVLQSNNKLVSRFPSKNKSIKLYSGKLQGNDESWARLTVFDDQYTGAIFDGSELFVIDMGENIDAALHGAKSMQSIKTVIYKSSEVSSELQCGGDHDEHNHDNIYSYKNLISEQTRQRYTRQASSVSNLNSISGEDLEVAAATATEQINLRIVTDPSYADSSNVSPEAQVLSQMNIVDGIFSQQVGVQFGITEIENLTSNGPLQSTGASALLNEFRTFVGNDNPGLAHLFTGRDIDSNTIGIAFLRGICRTSGVGLTQAGGRGTFGALTAAHEFGHNFGAPHDNQTGSACVDSPGTFLMNPSLNGSDQFSQCSLDQMSATLAGARCLVPVDNEPVAPAETCNFSADFTDNANDFVFVRDAQNPVYSSGSALSNNLSISIGGVDDADITNIEGVWSRECLSDNERQVTFEVNASLSQSSEYESDEFSQVSLRVNGTTRTLATLTGDGNGGVSPSTGNQQYSVTLPLNAGLNTVELVCFNNLKTLENETTQCAFNRLESNDAIVDEGDTEELCFPIQNQNSDYVMVCL